MKLSFRNGIILAILVILIGCQAQTAAPTSDTLQPTIQTINTQTVYPAPQIQDTAAYPVPPTSVAESKLFRTNSKCRSNGRTGVVTGYLLVQGEDTPYQGALYLGGMGYADNPDAPPLVGFSVESSPRLI